MLENLKEISYCFFTNGWNFIVVDFKFEVIITLPIDLNNLLGLKDNLGTY